MPTLRRLPSAAPLKLSSKDSVKKMNSEKNVSEASPTKFTDKTKEEELNPILRTSAFSVSPMNYECIKIA